VLTPGIVQRSSIKDRKGALARLRLRLLVQARDRRIDPPVDLHDESIQRIVLLQIYSKEEAVMIGEPAV